MSQNSESVSVISRRQALILLGAAGATMVLQRRSVYSASAKSKDGTLPACIVTPKQTEGPFFVEAQTHPWPGNETTHPKLVAGKTDIKWAWDPGAVPENVRSWYAEGDPIFVFARELVKTAGVSREEIERLDEEVRHQADQAARFALESPLPDPAAAVNFAYAGRGN